LTDLTIAFSNATSNESRPILTRVSVVCSLGAQTFQVENVSLN